MTFPPSILTIGTPRVSTYRCVKSSEGQHIPPCACATEKSEILRARFMIFYGNEWDIFLWGQSSEKMSSLSKYQFSRPIMPCRFQKSDRRNEDKQLSSECTSCPHNVGLLVNDCPNNYGFILPLSLSLSLSLSLYHPLIMNTNCWFSFSPFSSL